MSETSSKLLKEMMKDASIDKWCEYVEMGHKNFWTLQNNWMYRVESKFGQEAAVALDGLCYGRAIEVAAYRTNQFFDFEDDEIDQRIKDDFHIASKYHVFIMIKDRSVYENNRLDLYYNCLDFDKEMYISKTLLVIVKYDSNQYHNSELIVGLGWNE